MITLEWLFLSKCGNDHLGGEGYEMVPKKWLFRNDYLLTLPQIWLLRKNYYCNLGNDYLENDYLIGDDYLGNDYCEMNTKKWSLWNDHFYLNVEMITCGMIAMKWLRRNNYFGMISFSPTSEMITLEIITGKWLLRKWVLWNDY